MVVVEDEVPPSPPPPPEEEGEMIISASSEEEESAVNNKSNIRGCYGCRWSHFEGNGTAQGYCVGGLGRGPVYMCTVLLSTSFIFLASKEVGCTTLDGQKEIIIEDCPNRVYGAFKPAALITNIATISGVLIALLLPIVGAIMDYTPHRRMVGITTAILMIVTEAIQIGTTQQTWFGMAILEALSGVIFEIQLVAMMAYLPEIAKVVGESQMSTYNAYFLMVEVFGGQVCYLIVAVGIALVLGLDDVATAQVGQALAVVICSIGFWFAWGKKLPNAPPAARQQWEEEADDDYGHHDTTTTNTIRPNLLTLGFLQNWNTWKQINREYKHSLRWFLLATMFGEGGANAFVTVSVIVLTEHWGLDANEVGIVFIGALIGLTLACRPGELLCHYTNPSIAWRLSLGLTFVLLLVGALTLNRDNARPWAFIWAFAATFFLGMHYQSNYTCFTLMVPKGQEAEITGFWSYSRLILVWLPPLIFSLLVENDVSQHIGLISVGGFFVLAIATQSLCAPWDDILEEVHKKRLLLESETDVKLVDNDGEIEAGADEGTA